MTAVVVAFMDEVIRSHHGDISFVPYTPTSINSSGVNHPAGAAQSLVDYNYETGFFLVFLATTGDKRNVLPVLHGEESSRWTNDTV